MGNSPDGLPLPFLMNDKIWEYINDLDCNTTSLSEPLLSNNQVQIFPNPSNDILNIKSDEPILKARISTVQGQIIKTVNAQKKELSISMSELPSGVFFVTVELTTGYSWTGKLIKE